MKIAYVVLGFGEFAQAESFARYTKEQGAQNVFITNNKQLSLEAKKHEFDSHFSENTKTSQKIIQDIAPDVLFMCNSKTVYMYEKSIMKRAPLDPRPLVASLDSNWLFLDDDRLEFKVPKWIDVIFAVMPDVIFQQGLKENGGHYVFSDDYKDKIVPCGFIPSAFKVSEERKAEIREKLGIKDNEKLIYSYFGTREKIVLKDYLASLAEIVPNLKKDGKNIKLFLKLTKKQEVPKYDWLVTSDWLESDELIEHLSASDLVIQHHGLGTLPKVIHNQVPALCFVPVLEKEYEVWEHSPTFEIQAFEKLGLCNSLPYDFSTKDLQKEIEKLLFDESVRSAMKNAQKKHFESGEENAYNYLVEKLS